MLKKLTTLLYFIIPVLMLLLLSVDILSFYSNITISLVSFLRELIILCLLVIWYHALKKKLHFDELTIEQNLVRLFVLIAANFILVLGLKTLIHPVYSDGFPPFYRSVGAIFMSTIIAFITAITLVPAVLILRQLIFYKRRRNTGFFFNLFLIFASLNAVAVFITRQPVGYFRFTADTLANDLSLSVAILSIVILSFRNEWITYLPRKKKILYYFAGIPLYVGIVTLFDFAYRQPLPAYSLTLGALSYSIWLFLVIYGGASMIKLMFHIPTARSFDKKIQELNSIYELGRLLSTEQDYANLINLIVQKTTSVLNSDSTWLQLFDPHKKAFRIVSSHNLSDLEKNSMPLLKREGLTKTLVESQRAILINDLPHNRTYRHLLSWKKNAQSIVGTPFFNSKGQVMGILYATKTRTYSFDIDDVSLMEGIANHAAIAMENLQLLQESIERERLQQELKIARDVQLKLLPQQIPQIPHFEIETFILTAYEIGGDYYDFFEFADGKPGIIIGDVSGKGTSAALYMAEFKGILQSLAREHGSPASLVQAINKVIYPNIERHYFVSAIILKLDPERGIAQVVRAGHTPILYHPANGDTTVSIVPSGMGLGLDAGHLFNNLLEEQTIRLHADSLLLIYTDGLTEARNSEGDEFDEERLKNILAREANRDIKLVKEAILNSVLEFCGKQPLHDDLTFVLIKCNCTESPILVDGGK